MEQRILELEAQVAKLTTAINKISEMFLAQAKVNDEVLETLKTLSNQE